MDTKIRTKFQKADVLAILVVIAVAIAVTLLYLPRRTQDNSRVEIYRNGALLHTCSLDENTEFTVVGHYTNVIRVSGGSVSIVSSDCPGQDCVRSRAVSASGRSVVCLPNGVEVRVVSSRQDVDFVVG